MKPFFYFLDNWFVGDENNINTDVGAEEAVLKTIPWDDVHIQLVSLEVEHSDQASISRIMEGAGYRVYKTLTNANNPNIIQDIIYEKV